MKDMTKTEIIETCANEIAYWTYRKTEFKDSNANKSIKSAEIVINMATLLDGNERFRPRPIPENKTWPRAFEMFNLGDMTEMLMKALCTKRRKFKVTNTLKYDWMIKGERFEIKASLNASSKNTPIKGEERILFVNQKGVWLIDNTDGAYNGKRLQATAEIGEYEEEISARLGF